MNKTSIFTAAACMSMTAGSAVAGGLGSPTMEPRPAVMYSAPAMEQTNWTGFYAGVQLGAGSTQFSFNGVDGFKSDTRHVGLHVGYLYDLGSFVLGGELDKDWQGYNDDADDDTVHLLRLKARIGYDAGNFMPYLTGGVVRLKDKVTDSGFTDEDLIENGTFLGIGAEYKLSDRFRVGGEYLQHNFEDIASGADQLGVDGLDVEANTLSLRVSYSF